MSAFKQRQVSASVTLGERLRSVREEMGWSIDEASSRTGIRPAYLAAIEEGHYRELPGPVYARNFVRRYASVLEVSESAALEAFDQEQAVANRLSPPQSIVPPKHKAVRALVTPQGIRWFIIMLLGLGVLVYLGIELRNFTAPPMLDVAYPPEELTTTAQSIELRGTTNPEVTVTVNGKEILVDRSGEFRETLDLRDGLNTVVIRAQKKRGNATTTVRRILVTSPTNQ